MSRKQDNLKNIKKKTSPKNQKKRKKGKKRRKKLINKILFLTLLILILGITTIYTIFTNTVDKLNRVEINTDNLGLNNNDLKNYDEYNRIKNIMLFGVDTTNISVNGRSDAMLLLTIDTIHDKIKITSLMRDSYVKIDGYGNDKLNHAYSFGGPELAIKTINENFGLNIEEFITVDFSTLPQIIDILGGIKINITLEEIDDVNAVIRMDNYNFNKSTSLINSPGLQLINGDQALAYSRNRSSSGGDFARTERQRKIISSLFNKALEIPLTSYPRILNKVFPLITTNLTTNDIISLGKNIITTGLTKIEEARFPLDNFSEGGYVGDYWYLLYDETTTKQQIMDYIFNDNPPSNS